MYYTYIITSVNLHAYGWNKRFSLPVNLYFLRVALLWALNKRRMSEWTFLMLSDNIDDEKLLLLLLFSIISSSTSSICFLVF